MQGYLRLVSGYGELVVSEQSWVERPSALFGYAQVRMCFVDYEIVSATFTRLGIPTYLVYPLAIAKLLGIVAILTRKSEFLKGIGLRRVLFHLHTCLVSTSRCRRW